MSIATRSVAGSDNTFVQRGCERIDSEMDATDRSGKFMT